MIGLIELRRRKLQFGLITLVVGLISYLVLMINGLGVGLNVQAGSALRNFNAESIAYSDKAGLSVIRSELSETTVQAIGVANGGRPTAPIGYVAANYERANGSVRSAAFFGYEPGTIGEQNVVNILAPNPLPSRENGWQSGAKGPGSPAIFPPTVPLEIQRHPQHELPGRRKLKGA